MDFDDDNDDDTNTDRTHQKNLTDGSEEDEFLDNDDGEKPDISKKSNKSLNEEDSDHEDDDEIKDVRNAFVRHRRVTLEFIAMIEQEIYQNMLDSDDEDGDNDLYNDNGDDYSGDGDDYSGVDLESDSHDFLHNDSGMEQLRAARQLGKGKNNTSDKTTKDDEKEATPVKAIPQKNYGSNRPVALITNAKELRSFCESLVQSAQTYCTQHNNEPNAYAIGMDVEYCSLELDIRTTLPAMIQLCGPDKVKGPVGLIWIHRFPNHGRDLLTNAYDYEPLIKIFADPKLYKVGVGLTYDATNLAQWCGISDKKDVAYFFSGLVNLEDVPDNDNVRNKSLQEMAALVLHRNLPKIKGKRRSLQDRKRRKPTAHWRTDNITGLMKSYAANDVACAIDVWMRIHKIQQNKETKKKKKKPPPKTKKEKFEGIDI
jgi:hypothetical protein